MAKSTEHQHIDEQEITDVITQNIEYGNMESVRSEAVAKTIVICESCRKSIENVLLAKIDQLEQQEGCDEYEEETKLQTVISDLYIDAEDYLKGKQIILEEGLDLNCLEKVQKRLLESVDKYERSRRKLSENFKLTDLRLWKALKGEIKNPILEEKMREYAVSIFLRALLRRTIKTVLGDEEFLAKYEHTAIAYNAHRN